VVLWIRSVPSSSDASSKTLSQSFILHSSAVYYNGHLNAVFWWYLNVGFLFMSLTLLMSSTSSSLKSVSHESLGGILVLDTEDTCCLFLIWLTPRGTSTADNLPCPTLEREIFFAAHVWQRAGGHGPSKVASQHVWGNEENDSLIMNWWWLCLNQNSFLYWGGTETEVCVQKNEKILTCCSLLVHTSQAGHSHPVLIAPSSWKHAYNTIWQILQLLQVNNLSYILSKLITFICCFLKFLWLLYPIWNEYLYPQVIQL